MRKDIKTFLEVVKALLVDVYGEDEKHVHIDEEDDLVNYTRIRSWCRGRYTL
jgi:hypothetical protein